MRRVINLPKCPKCGCEFGKEDIKKKAEDCLRGLGLQGTVSYVAEKTTYVTGVLNNGRHFTMIFAEDGTFIYYRCEEKTDC